MDTNSGIHFDPVDHVRATREYRADLICSYLKFLGDLLSLIVKRRRVSKDLCSVPNTGGRE